MGWQTVYVFQCYKIINHVLQSETSATVADYTLNEAKLETTHGSKYLGVIIQNELKFTTHIKQKVDEAKQQLGMKKRAFHGATKNAKFLVYTIYNPVSFAC